jgi:hypothetical protein
MTASANTCKTPPTAAPSITSAPRYIPTTAIGVDASAVRNTMGQVHMQTRNAECRRAIMAHSATASAICTASEAPKGAVDRPTEIAAAMPSTVPSKRPPIALRVSAKLSCDTITPDIAAHTGCGRPSAPASR